MKLMINKLVSYYNVVVFVIVCVHSHEDDDEFRDIALEEEVNRISTQDPIFENEFGITYYEQNKLAFECKSNLKNQILFSDAFSPFKKKMLVKQLTLNNCIFTTTPLVNTIRGLNIDIRAIDKLLIQTNDVEPLPPANHFKGLNLTTFGIIARYFVNGNFFANNPEFLETMTNLTTLMVDVTEVPSISKAAKLKSLSVSGASIQNLQDYCLHLQVLSLSDVDESQLPESWPEACSKLVALRLENIAGLLEYINTSNIGQAVKNVRSLKLTYNDLDCLPNQMLQVAEELIRLDLSANDLSDDSLLMLPYLEKLTYLKLAGNKLLGWVLFDIMKQIPNLRELDVSYNKFHNLFCNYGNIVPLFTNNAKALERVTFEGMNMNPNCFENVHFSNLTYINLTPARETYIESLKLQYLPKTNATHLYIDLTKYYVHNVEFGIEDYKSLKKGNFSEFWGTNAYDKTNLTLKLSYIDCDCRHFELARSIREFPDWITLKGVECKDIQGNLLEIDLLKIHCSISVGHGCIHRFYFQDDFNPTTYMAAQCKTEMERFVFTEEINFSSLTEMNISNNKINSLQDTDWPDNVKLIDLRGNRISRLDAKDISGLFAMPDRQIYLSRNPLICDCDSNIMLDKLQEHHDQVLDFDELFCEDINRTLSTVTSYEVCLTGPRTALASGGTVVAAMFIVLLILWRYRLQVRIYLYNHGCCLFCFNESDEDADRPYDIFLSFSHEDEEYVINELLPKLEGEPDYFRVCVHYRDWSIGDWIPTQIMRSVGLSKRTIIVLSQNFVKSLWGSLEFRYAVASSAKEGRPRLLVLVLDDVLSGDLDPELQGYLFYNTYLLCNDPWFWEKLRYAMPRRKAPGPRKDPREEPDGLGMINVGTRAVQMRPLAINYPTVESV